MTPLLETLQRDTFHYFEHQTHPHTGLVADKTQPDSPSSIAASGMGLTVLCVAAERGWLARAEASRRALVALQFLERAPAVERGFYFHFLHMATGHRAWNCELSTIDTAFLIAGVLAVGAYFPEHAERAEALYRRVDWAWACNGAPTIGHGWTPEHGFLPTGWDSGYSEALLLYVLALGSPTHPIDPAGYRAWTATFEERHGYLFAAPLFIHQFSHIWLDFRGIRDDRCRVIGHDYFENSRRATLAQQQYAIANPHGFTDYSATAWGFTASDGPGPITRTIGGMKREFFGYEARGAPDGPDDGTLSPWGVAASLPFAPDLVTETLEHTMARRERWAPHARGFEASINATLEWASPWRFGINEGPIVLMLENHASELVWNLMRGNAHVQTGLRLAGFRA
jgi:hypothetical protein